MTADATTGAAPDGRGHRRSTDGPVEAESGGLLIRQTSRSALRTLSLALSPKLTVAGLREAQHKLAQFAATQQLLAVERPMFCLDADPSVTPRGERSWRMLLPIGGELDKETLPEDISVSRVPGGTYLSTTTPLGLPDLPRVYDFFMGHYLPRYKHRLTRPTILHRVVDGIESSDPAKLTITIILPVILSLEYSSSALAPEPPADA